MKNNYLINQSSRFKINKVTLVQPLSNAQDCGGVFSYRGWFPVDLIGLACA